MTFPHPQRPRPSFHTNILLYTGEVISRHDVIDEGVALIEKPFDANGLLQAVGSALHGNDRAADGTAPSFLTPRPPSDPPRGVWLCQLV